MIGKWASACPSVRPQHASLEAKQKGRASFRLRTGADDGHQQTQYLTKSTPLLVP